MNTETVCGRSLRAAREEFSRLPPEKRRQQMQATIKQLLGEIEYAGDVKTDPQDGKANESFTAGKHTFHVHRLAVAEGIPVLLLLPEGSARKPVPVVVVLGKARCRGC